MKFSALLRLMRPRQWTKNVFVLAPLIFSFKLADLPSVVHGLAAAVVFCLAASAVYIVNDVVDAEADRGHPKKRARPMAAREIATPQAVLLFLVLACVAAGMIVYVQFSLMFSGILCLYVAQSLGYSFGLKHITLLELFIVASGYVLRLLAGCAAIGETPSPWILAATGAIALLIATGKRRAEIAENHDPGGNRRSLRQYNLAFLDAMITMLAGVTVVTYLLFTLSDYAINRFHSPYFLATSVFVLYGVLRYMQVIKLAAGADDPTNLILTDANLRWTVVGWLMLCIGMIYF